MTPEKTGRIEIAKQRLNFSAAHFTIFSATEREDLHGHNFQVECELASPIDRNGLIFDYSRVKRVIEEICNELDEKTLLPENSPWLSLERDGDYIVGVYADERIPFLPRDLLTLPVANISVEELSHYFLDRVLAHPTLREEDIREMTIRVSSSPGQYGVATRVSESLQPGVVKSPQPVDMESLQRECVKNPQRDCVNPAGNPGRPGTK